MSLHSRPALERIRALIAQLRQPQPGNATTLAQQFKVTPKTIQRDLDFLRGLGHQITYHQRTHTYCFTELPAADDVLTPGTPTATAAAHLAALLQATDQVLEDPRFWWDWEDALRAARAKFPTAPTPVKPSTNKPSTINSI